MKYLVITYNNDTKEYHNYIEYNLNINEEFNNRLYGEIIINIIKL